MKLTGDDQGLCPDPKKQNDKINNTTKHKRMEEEAAYNTENKM